MVVRRDSRWARIVFALGLAGGCAWTGVLAGPAVPLAANAPGTPPAGAERVSFQSRDPDAKAPVPAELIRRQGDGPFPAVVFLHPCGGITRTMYGDWTPWFLSRGYLVLVPDSLAPWHQTTVCSAGAARTAVVHPTLRDAALDAYGALSFLRSRPDVIPERIATIGWSFGGVDDWEVVTACVRGAGARQSAGDPIDLHVYPGVLHEFDVPEASGAIRVGGTTFHVGFSPEATADAHTRVAKFLEEHLR